ncbi:MAG: amino acid adenylation domain-containing protein [Pseudonocardiaceae bacterium]
MTEQLSAPKLIVALRQAVAAVTRLDVEQVDADTSLREHGVNSLRALRVCGHVERELGITLRPWELLDSGSLTAVAERVLGHAGDAVADSSADEAVAGEHMPRRSAGPRSLSNAEERMWFLQCLNPRSCQYVFTAQIRLNGPLDAEVLRAAFAGVVSRHEPLRTRYHAGPDGEALATVTEPGEFPMPVIDLSELDDETRRHRVEQLTQQERETPFTLDGEPLLRATLVRLAAEHLLLFWSTHHIAFDGWSVPLLLEELDTDYRRIAAGKPAAAAQRRADYADFVAFQRSESDQWDERMVWWRKYLVGAQLDVGVPGDLPVTGQHVGRAATMRFGLTPALAERTREFAREQGTTAYVVLLTAFGALLHRYSGADDLLVGTPLTNRTRAAFHSMIGMFVNTVVVCHRFAGSPGFGELVDRTHSAVVEAFDRQDVPFGKLVEELRPSRQIDQTPLFRTMFDLHAFPLEQERIGLAAMSGPEGEPLCINALEVAGADAKFDLTLTVEEQGDALLGVIEYRVDRYTRKWVRRFSADYQALLARFLDAPGQPVSEPDLASTVGADGGASVLRGADAEIPPVTVLDLFAEQVVARPDAVAIIGDGESLTYAELDRRSDTLAERLRMLGAGRDVRVGVFGNRCPWLVVAMLAVLKSGAAYVMLDCEYPASRIWTMVDDSAARLVVATPEATTQLSNMDWPVAERTGDGLTIARVGDQPIERVPGTPGLQDLAYVLFTSGSTGQPKGVEIEHGALTNAYCAWRGYHGLDATRRYLQLASHTFDVFSGDVVRGLASGGRLVIAADELVLDPPRLYELMRRERVDYAEFVPAVMQGLLDHVAVRRGDLAFLRTVVLGADVWLVRDHRRLRRFTGPDTRVVNSFGITEATVDSSLYEGAAEEYPDDAVVPVGTPLPNTQMYVLDEHLRPVPIGVAGELWLAGAGLARGYAGRPDRTAERFVPDPFGAPGSRMYRTGDRARLLHDGNLVLLGRVDRQLKVRGVRIEPDEVEGALAGCPGVRRAVVTRSGRGGLEGLAAYLVRVPGAAVDVPDVRAYVRRILPRAACPTHYAVLDALPLTANGKIDIAALAAVRTEAAPSSVPDRPETQLQRDIATLWSQLLDVADVGVRQDFFELGGHSLLLTRLSALLRQRLGVQLSVRDLFEHPTVAGIADLASAAGQAGPAAGPGLRARPRQRIRVRASEGAAGGEAEGRTG